MSASRTALGILVCLSLFGCERAREESARSDAAESASNVGGIAVDPGAERKDPVRRAVAVLHGTALDPDVRGVVHFEAVSDTTVKVVADVEGLPAGEHAYHFHVYGDCSGRDAESAGTHFNLSGSSLAPPEHIDHITGNLGELVADQTGHAHAEATIEGVTMQGAYTILGRSVIVHVKGNDPSQPPIGGAGKRLACGVVGVAETKA